MQEECCRISGCSISGAAKTPARSAVVARGAVAPPHPETSAAAGPVSGPGRRPAQSHRPAKPGHGRASGAAQVVVLMNEHGLHSVSSVLGHTHTTSQKFAHPTFHASRGWASPLNGMPLPCTIKVPRLASPAKRPMSPIRPGAAGVMHLWTFRCAPSMCGLVGSAERTTVQGRTNHFCYPEHTEFPPRAPMRSTG